MVKFHNPLNWVKYMFKNYTTEINNSIKNAKIYEWDSNMESAFTFNLLKKNHFNKIAILNFADFFIPGGAFIDGSHAQEECLCHESSLYPVLYSFDKTYYSNNRKSNKGYMFESRALYTPDIVFERLDDNKTFVLKADVITCAAPNLTMDPLNENVYDIMEERIKLVYTICKEQGIDLLVAGAWGCGVFGLDASKVTELFIKIFSHADLYVVFSVYNDKSENYKKVRDTYIELLHYDSLNNQQLDIKVKEHEKFVFTGGEEGKGLFMYEYCIKDKQFIGSVLDWAIFKGCRFVNCTFDRCSLYHADFIHSDFINTTFINCFLHQVDFRYTDWKDNSKIIFNSDKAKTSLYTTNFSNLTGDINFDTLVNTPPQEGSYIGFKAAYDKDNYKYIIVKLKILDDSKRSSSGSDRKCRASKVEVLGFYDPDTKEQLCNCLKVVSINDNNFRYRVGEIIEIKDFDENKWNACGTGIHHFLSFEEAVAYIVNLD